MKLSEILYAGVADLWKEAAGKPFVVDMARGTLDRERFRSYMIQDHLYLTGYIDLLKRTMDHTEDPELTAFLDDVIRETRNESERVHIPNMRKAGVTDEELASSVMAEVIAEYLDYMRRQLEEEGLLAGLTALLQCSWVYAFIGQEMTEKYPEDVAASPFGSWFEAYTCHEYVICNQKWIDALDKESKGISLDKRDRLCRIFRTCAMYENRFWDWLYNAAPNPAPRLAGEC